MPIQAEELCRTSVDHLLDFVGDFRLSSYPAAAGAETDTARPLELEGVFLTMTSTRTRMGRHVAGRVAEDFGDVLFDVDIPRTTRLSEMALRGKPAVIYDRRSPGSMAYFDLADELVYRFRQEKEVAEAEAGFPVETEAVTVSAKPGNNGGNGLDRFLAELGGPRQISARIPSFEEPSSPEMVSLDDLLAEEEDGNGEVDGDEWSDGGWPSSRRQH